MKRKRRMEIMVEQHQLLVIHSPVIESGTLECAICPTQSPMIIAEDAATLLSMTRREVYRAIETGNVHFIETAEGILFVCIESLFSQISTPAIQFQERQLRGPERETDC